jgi:hypothetical protein
VRISVTDEFGRMLGEKVEACFTIESWHLLEAAEDNHDMRPKTSTIAADI